MFTSETLKPEPLIANKKTQPLLTAFCLKIQARIAALYATLQIRANIYVDISEPSSRPTTIFYTTYFNLQTLKFHGTLCAIGLSRIFNNIVFE
jgi:hypothetical protein